MGLYRKLCFSFLLFCLATKVLGQANSCQTAPLLCSLSELDGFSASMPETNSVDEPAPFCGGGNPQNMTWFSFIAGNTSATMEITFTNCQGGNNLQQIQYGIYTDCAFNTYLSSACQGTPIGTATPVEIQILDMIPGDDYFFFIDGDVGTYCDYEISVTSGGWANLMPQPTSLDCTSPTCPPDGNICSLGETFTFEPQGVDLTVDYVWTITPGPPDGPAGMTVNPDNTASFTFNNPGEYEICVYADNGCSQTVPVCYDLNVIETDAGDLAADPETLCPTETSNVTVTDYFTTEPVLEALIVVGPDNIVIDVVNGDAVSVTYDECGTVTVYSYNYLPGDAPDLPAVGSSFSMPNCGIDCCDLESIEITFEDDITPTFLDLPADITIECDDPIPPLMQVTWDDNCEGTGLVDGTQMDDYNTCMGGTITRTWSFTDLCDNTVEESQVITINAQMEGSFSSEPADETYDCVANIPPPMDLTWMGACEGTAVVTPVDGPDPDLCAGGTKTRTWSYNDPCGSFTEYVQTFTILGSTGGDFINPPGPITVMCDLSDLPPIPSLEWMGDCSGTATVAGTEVVDIESCSGGTVIREWSYTDPCGTTANYSQTITVSPPPAAVPIDPPPANIVLECNEVPTSFPDLEFSNNQTGDCAIMGTAEPEIMGNPGTCGGTMSVIWIYTDACFTPYTYVQNITISPAAAPEFIDPPADMTISCLVDLPTFEPLNYDNGVMGPCGISGVEDPIENIDGDICGGEITALWQIPDPCVANAFITHIQTITIEPIAEPMWIDPPQAVINIECSDDVPPAVDLAYTNGTSGACNIMGMVPPTIDGTSDVCGGTISYTWEFEDQCDRILTYEQTINIGQASAPSFIDVPADITIGCNDIPPSPPSLNYSNNESGVCDISGDIPATVIDDSNSCGGTIMYNWEFTDPCGRDITASQLVTITEAPAPEYINPPADITVACNNIPAPASILQYTNNDACSIMGETTPAIDEDYDICGGEITNTWNFVDDCGRLLEHIQIITVNPAPIAAFTDVPANTTVACGDDATDPGNLSYTNGESGGCTIAGNVPPTQSGDFTACGGNIQFTWDFIDECGRPIQAVQTVVVDPAPAAEFINLPPPDITVSCADFQTTPPLLEYTNNEIGVCNISGDVPGIVIGTPNPCNTTVQYRWEFSDACGRNISFNQNVTIEAADQATFDNLPGPVTVECDEVAASPPLLGYTNGASGICLISGDVPGIQSGVFDECGGSITYTWTFTDQCNRTISHDQVITVNPAPDPVFINLPPDITLGCGEAFPVDPELEYTNSEGGVCSISGTEIATSSVNGNVTTYTWSYTNDCNGITIDYSQNVTGVPTPDISIDPLQATICIGEAFDLSTIDVTDASGNTNTITYAINGTLIADPNVSPTATTVYTIIATNGAGCSDEATFTVNVDDPPFAGTAMDGQVCAQGGLTYGLFDYLTGAYTPGGTWFDTDNSGANIDNPNMVSFDGVTPGFYTFMYTVFSSNSCPDAEVAVEIEVISELEFEILSVQCDPGGATYSINVFSNGNNIFSNPGDVTVIDANNVIINNIPEGSTTVVSAIDQNAFCISDQVVSAPDCDCPTIPSPISGGNITICEGDPLPELSVTVDNGLIANWYVDQTSTDPLIANSLVYTPTETAPGTYDFYVEAEDQDGCVSVIRTLVTLIINAKPTLTEATIPICQDNTGMGLIDLQTINPLVNSNAGFTYEYFLTITDAENENNPLNDNYTISSTESIFVLVTNGSGCKSITEVSLELIAPPTFDLQVNNEACLDSMDGSIIITSVDPTGTTFSINNIDFQAVADFTDLDVGSYTLYAMSPEGCMSTTPFDIGTGLEIQLSEINITCNSNGTDSDSSDDYYEITVTIDNNVGSVTEVNITANADDLGNYPYGITSFQLPADGSDQIITITDIASGCSAEFSTGELNPCSSTCSISIDLLDIVCNGNGTDADPSDDYYEITINASAVNGAANNSFNVTVDNATVANFTYGVGGTITIPAQGQNATIAIVDNADNQCFSSETIGPLNPCSNTCVLTIDNQNFICDNNATIGVPGDDFYIFSFNVLATNTTSTTFDLLVDNVVVGTYNYNELSEYQMPADNADHSIEFVDSNDNTCTIMFTSPLLTPCSGECSINIQVQESVCQNQNTGMDPSDDTFIANVFINVVGGSGSWLIVESGQTGNSGEIFTVGPYPISGGNVLLTVQDANNPACEETMIITAPETCSSCDDTVDAGADQEIDCDVTSSTLTGTPSSGITGIWTGPNNFSEEMNVVEVSEPGMYLFTVDFGEGCILTDTAFVISNNIEYITQNIICNNNGTLGVPEDDYYTFTFEINNSNPNAQMYEVTIDDVSIGIFNYTTEYTYDISADGNTHVIEIQDVDNESCILTVETDQLVSCSEECIVIATAQNIQCDDENTADDSSDDTWTADILITQSGGSGTWTISETGQSGISGEIINIGPLLISDGLLTFTISDADVAGCSTILEVTPPPSCSDCNESVEAGADWILDCTIQEAMLSGTPSIPIIGTWTGPGSFSINANEVTVDVPGWYYYTADFGNGCIRTDSLEITVSDEVPAVFAGDPQSITCIVDSVILTGTVTGGSGNFTYQWQNSDLTIISTEITIKVGEAGDYFFTVRDEDTDCTSPPSLVQVLDETGDLNPEINANPSFILDCMVDEITLQVVEEPNVEYRWYVGSVLITGASTTLTVVDAGVFRLEATHLITGCMGMKELVIEDQIQYPIPFIQPADILDCNNGGVTLDGSSSQTGATITYTWLNADSTVIATNVDNLDINEGGTYYLQLLDTDNNCINFDTMIVVSNIDLPQIVLDDMAFINCDDDEVIINLDTDIDAALLDINWMTENGNISSGSSSNQLTVSSDGAYTVSVVNPENNCETLDTIMILLPDQIEASVFDINDESCEESNNGSISITSVTGGTAPYTYLIDNMPIDGNSIENLTTGTYDIQIIDDNGCDFNDQVIVDLQEAFEVDLLPEITITQGEISTITATVNIPDTEIESIVWSPADNLSCATCLSTEITGGLGDQVYTIGITDINGCYGEAMIMVRSNEEIVITIPNIFKPTNQAQGNNNFTVYTSIDGIVNTLQIYDRWGNLMHNDKSFSTNQPELGWDGKFNGVFVEQGVYVYYAEISIGGDVVIKSGDITVVR